MRRNLVPSLPKVEPDGSLGVDRVSLVGIDSHAEQTRVGLKERFTAISAAMVYNKIVNINLKRLPLYEEVPYSNLKVMLWP